jgi:hypothetical protein
VKITSSSWAEQRARSRAFDDDVATDVLAGAALVAGFFGFVFGVGVYATIIFCVVQILHWQDAIGFTLGWGASLLLSVIYVIGRTIDKAFFRTRTL